MSLKDFADDERTKNTILNIIKVLMERGPHSVQVSAEEWTVVVEKMFEEWKDLDKTSAKLWDEGKYAPLRAMAKKMDLSPRELLVRTKLMYFVAKSEILRMELEDLKDA